jgi:hypothetical protein
MPALGRNLLSFNRILGPRGEVIGPRHSFNIPSPTIGTAAGNYDTYCLSPEDGNLQSIEFSGVDALAGNDTNYITWTVTNLGRDGVGVVQMLAVDPANTTKLTGGKTMDAHDIIELLLSSDLRLLAVRAGDKLRIRATVTGTLANSITVPLYLVRYN